MQLAGVELYVASVSRLAILRSVPSIAALVMAVIGMLTLHSAVDVNTLGTRSLVYLLAWTALSVVILLYAFLGAIGSMWGKAADLDRLDPSIPTVTVSWKYAEPIAALCLALVGINLLYK